MGSDIQRALLWILFGLSAFMLYDRWEVYNGRPSFFGAETQQVATTEAPKNEAALPSQSQTASLPAEAKTAVKAEPIQVETDLLKLSFDPEGAVIIGSELRKEKQTIPWTDTGLVGMILGNKAETPADVVLFTEQKGRTYLAQTGLIGGPYPTHKTQFKLVPGPLKMADGQDNLTVKFEGESGGVKVIKSFTFERGHYGIKVSHEVVNNTASEIKPSVYYQLTRDGEKPEGESTMVNAYTGAAVYTDKDKFQKVSFSDIADGDKDFQAKADNGWIAMIQHYFVSAWVPTQGVERENYTNTVGEKLYAVGSIREGYREGAGWALTEKRTYQNQEHQDQLDAATIYSILETEILPLYYARNKKGYSEGWIKSVKNSIAQIAPHYTMKRQLDDYYSKFYCKEAKRFKELSANDNAKAKEIAAWKEEVVAKWDSIEIVSKEREADIAQGDIESGKEYTITVVVDEKGLNDAVGLELVTTYTTPEGKQHVYSVEPFSVIKKEGDLYTFQAKHSLSNAGSFKVAYRMFPKNQDLPHRQDFCYVRWFV